MFNLALKNVFDDVASELSTAILQYLHTDLSEKHTLLCLVALTRFIEINSSDVMALVKMLGPDLNKLKGKTAEIDQLVEAIESK